MMTLKEIKPDDPNYYKPLDELIEDLGHAEPASRYGDVQIMVEDLTDALHYLKLFQADCERVRGQLEDLKQDYRPNDPLTWDELRTMEGKPVWVEMEGYKPNWGIVMNQDERNGRLLLCGYDKVAIRIEINEEDEGKTWQAYRKERG